MPATKRAKSPTKKPETKPQNTTKRPRGRPPVADRLPPPEAEYLMIRQVAAILQISEDTVGRLVHGTEDVPPELDSVRVGFHLRIPRNSLDAYIARQTKKAGTTKVDSRDRARLGM